MRWIGPSSIRNPSGVSPSCRPRPDAGPVWATYRCPLREASKSSVYRDEIATAAMRAMLVAVQRFENGLFVPVPLDYSRSDVRGRYRPVLTQERRRIDWSSDPVSTILRKIRSADGAPGVVDDILGEPVHLYGAHLEGGLIGRPGDILAKRYGAICRAAVDGAVWVSHLKRAGGSPGEHFKLPATHVLADRLAQVPEVPIAIDRAPAVHTYRDIWYEERSEIGYVNFSFYNGAMGTDHCLRLAEAVAHAQPAADPGHRADGRARLLVERHPPQPDRGRRDPPTNPGGTSTP